MKFESLSCKTLTKVLTGYDKLTFYCLDGSVYELVGSDTDCGSSCRLEDITEGYEDILNDSMITEAYMNHDERDDSECDDEDHWWTFYRIITTKGTVVIRWSNYSYSPYYSSEVYFNQIKPPK